MHSMLQFTVAERTEDTYIMSCHAKWHVLDASNYQAGGGSSFVGAIFTRHLPRWHFTYGVIGPVSGTRKIVVYLNSFRKHSGN